MQAVREFCHCTAWHFEIEERKNMLLPFGTLGQPMATAWALAQASWPMEQAHVRNPA